MKQSHLFTKTRRETPKDEVSQNAQLLIRAGYIQKEAAGVYSLLPLGLRVFKKIQEIIREEMNAIGGQEVLFSVFQDPEIWKKTDRWDDEKIDVWFKTELKAGGELGLAFTHEEPIVRALSGHVSSYRDLPKYIYHFQSKFRNELRAKSGIMRGREFVMKDFYSFTRTEEELDQFYKEAGIAYENIFRRMGLGDITYLTFASGGVFSKFSHEFQTISTAGEDTIYVDEEKHIAVNQEVFTDEVLKDLELEKEKLIQTNSIEVGNIFKLGTRYAEALGLRYKDEKGQEKPVVMGSYGIGLGRLMGTIVEVLCDEKGIVWPESVAPYALHLIELSQGDAGIKTFADELYRDLVNAGIEVLYDDRHLRAGEKFADSDLLGIPWRAIIGKNATPESIEVVRRKDVDKKTFTRAELLSGAFAKP
ncbi:prolyl-tRNA synthetase [Candidatus Kaiserbacteria bacterium]|nr:prolyl-tRNA synthetase [Candidatus Kaiserbacteria bacterium]